MNKKLNQYKRALVCILILFLTLHTNYSYAQWPGYGSAKSTATPPCNSDISANVGPGEYVTFPAANTAQYQLNVCATANWDVDGAIYQNNNGTFLTSTDGGDNPGSCSGYPFCETSFCSWQVYNWNWTSNYNGTVRAIFPHYNQQGSGTSYGWQSGVNSAVLSYRQVKNFNNSTSTANICEGSTRSLSVSGAGTGGSWSVVSGPGSVSGNTLTAGNPSGNSQGVTVRYTLGQCTEDVSFTIYNDPGTANNTTSTASICEAEIKTLIGSPGGGSWSIISGGGSISGNTYTPANISSNTTVTIRYTISANGPCPGSTDDVSFTVIATAGNPNTFGSNQWNVYAYNGNDYNLGSGATYYGFYTEPSVTYDTRNRWCSSCSPASASGYQGCDPGVDQHTVVSKRRGFPCAYYTIDVYGIVNSDGHDDDAKLFVNGTQVFNHNGCCDNHLNVWSGVLGPNDEIEFRHGEGGGGSYQALRFNETPLAGGTLSATTTSLCVGGTTTFNLSGEVGNFENLEYRWNGTGSWNTTWQNSVPYTWPASNAGNTLHVRARTGGASGCSDVYSNTVQVSVFADPTSPSLSKSPNVASVCEGTTVSATASGGSGGTGSCSYEYQYQQPGSSSWTSGNSFTPTAAGTASIRARRTCSGNGCDASSWTTVSWTVNADPGTANNTTSTASICESETKALTASPSGGTWSVISGGGSISGSTYTPANISSNTTVTIRYTISSNGACPGSTDDVSFTVFPTGGNPNDFGSNQWNVYAYHQNSGYNVNDNLDLNNLTYRGYYTDATVNITSTSNWPSGGSPSDATNWDGCDVNNDNHVVVYKRQGFPCGEYAIDLDGHDDAVRLYIDDVKVYQNNGCCNDRGVIWEGHLDGTSKVEFRVTEGGGGSNLSVDFDQLSPTASYNVTEGCVSSGTIEFQNPANGASRLVATDFSSQPTNTQTFGSAIVSGGELVLTSATNSDWGGFYINNPNSIDSKTFTAVFEYRVWDGSGADGFSFNFGPLPNLTGYAAYEQGITGTGLSINFRSYTHNRLEIEYDGVVRDFASFNPRTSSYSPIYVTVDENDVVTVYDIDRNVLVQEDLTPYGYNSVNTSGWKFGFAARTGGANDKHSLTGLKIDFMEAYEYSINGGSSWQNSPTFSGLSDGSSHNLAVQAAGTSCNTSLGSETIELDQPPTAPTGVSGTTNICVGDNTTLTATGGTEGSGATYEWFTGGCGGTSVGGSSSSITVSPASTTTYSVRRVGNTTCTNTTSCFDVTVTVDSEPTASISYDNSPYCDHLSGTVAVNQSGASGGTYSSSPAGLTINSSTGAITPSSSTAGTYTVTYTFSNGACTGYTTNTSVTIADGDGTGMTWTGAAPGPDPDWNNPRNWSCYGVPNQNTDVVVPNVPSGNATNFPEIQNGESGDCYTIELQGANPNTTYLRLLGNGELEIHQP